MKNGFREVQIRDRRSFLDVTLRETVRYVILRLNFVLISRVHSQTKCNGH